jgi:hypothetical protein
MNSAVARSASSPPDLATPAQALDDHALKAFAGADVVAEEDDLVIATSAISGAA